MTAKHSVPTLKLISLLKNSKELEEMLVASIEKARKINPDKSTNPIQSITELYDFLDRASSYVPWKISPTLNSKQPTLFDCIEQVIAYFWFIFDQPLDCLRNKGLYYPALQYAEPVRTWLIEYTRYWGDYLSSPSSWNQNYLKMVESDSSFGLLNNWYESPDNWHSFNDFFARKLASPEVRPIADKDNSGVVISPADSQPMGVWDIDKNSYFVIKDENNVIIKSTMFQNADMLLPQGSDFRGYFAGGKMTHTFLDVNSYHRYHFPVSGKILSVDIINQDNAAGGLTIWDKERQKYILISNYPGWQSIETRGCVVIDMRGNFGIAAVLPVGMSQVSSVNFEESVKVGHVVEKGEELGWFMFGGSDIIMMFQEKANFSMLATTGHNLLMGQRYGLLSP